MIKRICLVLVFGCAFAWSSAANAAVSTCGAFWPRGSSPSTVIPVCYTAAEAARPGFSSWLPIARQAVESTWGRAANVSFSGWRQCPANVTGEILVIDYSAANPVGTVTCHVPGDPGKTYQDPASIAQSNWAHTAVHEFGHALGFKHEQDRFDNPYWSDGRASTGDPTVGCSNVTVTTPYRSPPSLLLTSYDYYSIMNYCGEKYDLGVIADPFHFAKYINVNRATLSPLDVNGVRALYSVKPASSIIAGNGLALTQMPPARQSTGMLTLAAPAGSASQKFDSSRNRISSDYFYFPNSVLTTPSNTSLRYQAPSNVPATLNKQRMQWVTGGANCVVAESAAAGSKLLNNLPCDTQANQYWDADLPFSGAIRLNGTNLCAWHGNTVGNLLQLATCPSQPSPDYVYVEGHSMLMSSSGFCVEQLASSGNFGVGLAQCGASTPSWLTMQFRGPITVASAGNRCLSSTVRGDNTLGGPVACDGSLAQTWDFWMREDYNLALGQFAYQSSVNTGGEASRAVDGNTDGNFYDGSVALTNLDAGAWWTVSLGGTHEVHSVDIYNRTDWGSETLSHFNVYAWDESAWQWYLIADYSNFDTTNVEVVHVPVAATTTQNILIVKTDTNYLQMAEVQVIGR
jgi:F5/8 type C domain/Astacin (Peptidase family M12A)